MSLTDTMPSDNNVSSAIKFLSTEDVTGCKIHQRLCMVQGGDDIMSLWSIY